MAEAMQNDEAYGKTEIHLSTRFGHENLKMSVVVASYN